MTDDDDDGDGRGEEDLREAVYQIQGRKQEGKLALGWNGMGWDGMECWVLLLLLLVLLDSNSCSSLRVSRQNPEQRAMFHRVADLHGRVLSS